MKKLIGTEKQIAWAESIRTNVLEVLDFYESGLREEGDSESDIKTEISKAKEVLDNEKAPFFIDRFGTYSNEYDKAKKVLEEKFNEAKTRLAITRLVEAVGEAINHDNIEWFIPTTEHQLYKKYIK